MQPLQVQGVKVNIINGAVDLDVHEVTRAGANNRTLHMTYGDYSLNTAGSQQVKRSQVDADIDVSISNERNAGNGAVTCTVTTKYYNFHRTLLDANPVMLNTTIHIYASQERQNEVFSQTSLMQSAATYRDVSFSYDVTIPALGTMSVGLGRYYNDGETTTADDEFNGGLEVRNPNPPDYRPGARMIGGAWKSLNRPSGMRARRVNGQWVELRTENGGVGTDNPPSRYYNGQWFNQKKIGDEND